MVPVRIVGVHVDARSGATIVLLAEEDAVERVLPIIVGPVEARAIVLGLQGVVSPRPGTHDLLIDIVNSLKGRVTEVAVTALREGTFFAELEIETGEDRQRISSRPSDGLALATRLHVPVYVSEDVLDNAGVRVVREVDTPFDEHEIEQIMSDFTDFLSEAEPEDFLLDGPEDPDDEGDIALPESPDDEGDIALPEDPDDEGDIALPESPDDEGDIALPESPDDEGDIALPESPDDEGDIALPESPDDEGDIALPEAGGDGDE